MPVRSQSSSWNEASARRRRGSCRDRDSRRGEPGTSDSRASPASSSGALGATTCRRSSGSSTGASPIRSCSSLPRPWCRTRSPAGRRARGARRRSAAWPGSVAGCETLLDSKRWQAKLARTTRLIPMARLVAAGQVVMLARQHWHKLEPSERRRLITLVRARGGRRGRLTPRRTNRAGSADRQGRSAAVRRPRRPAVLSGPAAAPRRARLA